MLSNSLRVSILLAVVIPLLFNEGKAAQASGDQSKALEDLINGSIFETKSRDRLERYKYDKVHVEHCSIAWIESHEVWENKQRTLAEVTEITVPVRAIDSKTIRVDRLKESGVMVSILTKGLEPGIVTRQHMQWGEDPPTDSSGIATGTAFYFADSAVAEKVLRTINSLIPTCSTK